MAQNIGQSCRNRAGFRRRYAQRRRGGQRSRLPARRDVRAAVHRPDGCVIDLLCERQRRGSCGQRAAARGVGGRGGGAGAKKTQIACLTVARKRGPASGCRARCARPAARRAGNGPVGRGRRAFRGAARPGGAAGGAEKGRPAIVGSGGRLPDDMILRSILVD
jgi:hypothetical protein